MDNFSNLGILINILISGMLTVFFVLFLVFLLGKLLVKLMNFFSFPTYSEESVEKKISNRIKDISGGKGRVLKITKLN